MNNRATQKHIKVFASWRELKQPTLMGVLFTTLSRGKEIFSFEYDSDWLQQNSAQQLDPSLGLYQGRQFAPIDQNNFGIFLDSSPDRWGRMLMRRREDILSRKEKREPNPLHESDYLLGVHDEHRLGALRFSLQDHIFLDNRKELASPPWVKLRELEQASQMIERQSIDDPNYEKWLNMLIAPGGSLGGHRPKASVMDEKNNLWIAKFPSHNDNFDRGAWEYVVHQLAVDCGIHMPKAKLKLFSGKHHIFLVQRFDRIKNKRIHFASAMTMLQRKDGDDASSGASYLELAEFLIQHGANTKKDLEQLWKRIVFSICVSNTDDHLRNHGFLLTPSGWILSPAYDINPVETAHGLKLNISENDNSLDLALALQVAQYFRLNKNQAKEIMNHIVKVVKTWKKVAHKISIRESEQEQMKRAFILAESYF